MVSEKRAAGILEGDSGDENTVRPFVIADQGRSMCFSRSLINAGDHSARAGLRSSASCVMPRRLRLSVQTEQNRGGRSNVHYTCANEIERLGSCKVCNLQEKMPAISRKPNREMLSRREYT